ncbi:hypothetical protein CcCBS67573_g08303 [Chytriomyces confervae]|uniref:EGF-like domain-containing protein n=1 Tax=Chytriomyces confervae TaxID=246404 RepID=A0A507ENP8_9FUNG|nr:hypothetical protein CcCBS67573_g08303 [Chytriomyces confervae]
MGDCQVLSTLTGLIPATAASCCDVTGITCVNGRVTAIDASSVRRSVSGSLPENIGALTELTSLRLPYQTITGFIPESIGLLTKLSTIDLGANLLKGPLPSSIANLTTLENLSLGGNTFNSKLPEKLPSSLTTLDIRDGGMLGTIPDYSNLVSSVSISLDVNQLEGRLPAYLGNLPQLIFLRLGENQISGTIPTEFGNLLPSASIQLQKNRLEGTVPPAIAKYVNLNVEKNCLFNQTGDARNPACPTGTESAPMNSALIGGIVGGIVGFLLIVGGIVYTMRRRASFNKLAEESEKRQQKPTTAQLESSEIVLSIDTTDPTNETRSIASEASSIAVIQNSEKVTVKQSFLDRNLATGAGEASTTPYASKKDKQKLAANQFAPVSPTDGESNVQAGPVQPAAATAVPEEGSDPHLWSVNETGRWCSSVLNIGPHVQRNVAVHKIDGPLLLKLTREDMMSHLQLTAQQASTLEDAIVQLFESQGSRALPQYAE